MSVSELIRRHKALYSLDLINYNPARKSAGLGSLKYAFLDKSLSPTRKARFIPKSQHQVTKLIDLGMFCLC